MKRIPLLIALVLIFSFGQAYADGSYCHVDPIDGLYTDGSFIDHVGLNKTITYHFNFNNDNPVYLEGATNGWRIYITDVVGYPQSDASIATAPGGTGTGGTYTAGTPWYNTTDNMLRLDWFDLEIGGMPFFKWLRPTDPTGVGADTVTMACSKMANLGMPGLTQVELGTVDITVTDAAMLGWYLCIDSSFYPNSGYWKWVGAPSPPAWNGPICYDIVTVPNFPPEITNCNPPWPDMGHCDQICYTFTAEDEEEDDFDFVKISGPGSVGDINPTTGEWCYTPSGADVGVSPLYLEIAAEDTYGIGPSCKIDLTFINHTPSFTSGVPGEFAVGKGKTYRHGVTAADHADDHCDNLVISVLSVVNQNGSGPAYVGDAEYDDVTEELVFSPDATMGGNDFDVTMQVYDGVAKATHTGIVIAHVLAQEPFEVQIEKVHDAIQGMHHYVDVNLNKGSEVIGGFDILIAYDASALSFQTAIPGPLFGPPPGCMWEYFTYRFGPDGNCGNACPSGLLRVVAIAETNNGPNHPDWACYDALLAAVPFPLFSLDFLLTNDRTFECMYVPIRFFWMDCGDNSIAFSYRTDLNTVVQGVSRYVIDFDLIGHIEDMYTGFPTYTGVQDFCFDNDPQKPLPEQFVDFYNGGIDIICADSIDARGDINLNGNSNEIADAVLFSNYFVKGLQVFNVNVQGQIAATDVNADGLTLSVADLVYLIRVIVGDAVEYAKLGPVTASYTAADGILSVDAEMGAAFVVAAGNVVPRLLADNMDLMYQFDGVNTRILVSSMEQGATFQGEFLDVNGSVLSVELATYEGAPVVAKASPNDYKLGQNYPNPFNPVTTIGFALPQAGDFTLTIYNVTGQTIATFTGTREAGNHTIEWDASDQASGIYFYKLNTNNFTDTKKMVLLK